MERTFCEQSICNILIIHITQFLYNKYHAPTLFQEKLIATLNADKAAIVKLYAELEAQPSTSFEQSVVTANTAQFSLTPASMASVKVCCNFI
jgi:hypothetical protein